MKPLSLLRAALSFARRAAADPAGARRRLAEVVSERLAGGVEEAPPATIDGHLLEETAQSLQVMLSEIDELSSALPSDAKVIGLAARELVERSLEECRKPAADAERLARDMEQVGQLALAMRERLLLSPWSRTRAVPN